MGLVVSLGVFGLFLWLNYRAVVEWADREITFWSVVGVIFGARAFGKLATIAVERFVDKPEPLVTLPTTIGVAVLMVLVGYIAFLKISPIRALLLSGFYLVTAVIASLIMVSLVTE